ncbi:cache domain-containing protein [Alphaproteobacteria bacterium]|nr:cache domain-containing protein [Alphaproteobacteria bacterium]
MNYIKIFFISCILISLISKSISKDFGTEEEATNMLERAVNLINYNKIYALNIFTERTGGFNFKDLYPFCADDNGILTGHPFNVGFDLLKFIDSDGKNVGKEFLQVAQVGKINKVTFKITYPKDTIKTKNKEYEKTALVTKVGDQICAVGYHNN